MATVKEEKSKVDKVLSKYSTARSNIIPLLQGVQAELGYLPKHAIMRISEHAKVAEAEVYGIATFYAQFRFKPIGRYVFTVCRGTACHVLGSQKIVEELQEELKIKPGETTPDLMFSLETVACFGSCALAPLTVVEGKVYGRITPKKVRELVKELRARHGGVAGGGGIGAGPGSQRILLKPEGDGAHTANRTSVKGGRK